MKTDERFERGREVVKLLLDSAIDEEGCFTIYDEDCDMAYFIERAVQGERRKEQRRAEYPYGRRTRTGTKGDFVERREGV